ncbi:MAG: hypothetical protein CME31_09325 [Gimesia sp.]|uniref:Uncharacterized protein n=1 Tax=Gimesia maris TaxID=122 RepID=A0A3D3REZ6_9PLAN|nr:hypothetical protein [Gimesia sp.]HCO27385.1 hypothetical protein [Gimesia maris]|tara:strand:- start:22276 stop:23742 length:1467 start_codon:yes stop_codon:yes gene_type:complete
MNSAKVMACVFLLLWAGVQETSVGQSKPGEAHLVPVQLPPLSVTKFEGTKTTVKLPAPYVNDAVDGGGGRYLIFQLQDKKQLAIFDVVEARTVKVLDVGSDDLAVAAGADKLVVLLRDQNQIERYSLQTFEKELSVALAPGDPVSRITMGAASNGPILVGAETGESGHPYFLDLQTLQPSAIQMPEESWESVEGQDLLVKASANGRIFCLSQSGEDPTFGTMVISVQRNQARVLYFKDLKGFKNKKGEYLNVVLPGPEGKAIYTERGTRFPDLVPLAKETEYRPVPHGIPALHGDLCMTLDSDSSAINIYRTGSLPVLTTVPEIWTKDRWPDYNAGLKTAHARLRYVPDAHLITFLPESRDEIVLHRFDIDAALGQAGNKYLFVTSFPTRNAERGETYQYQVRYKSNTQPVKYRVLQGPVGMTVTPEGLVQWDVPENSTSDIERIHLFLEAPSGHRFLQAFVIHVAYKPGVLGEPPVKPDRKSRASRR